MCDMDLTPTRHTIRNITLVQFLRISSRMSQRFVLFDHYKLQEWMSTSTVTAGHWSLSRVLTITKQTLDYHSPDIREIRKFHQKLCKKDIEWEYRPIIQSSFAQVSSPGSNFDLHSIKLFNIEIFKITKMSNLRWNFRVLDLFVAQNWFLTIELQMSAN